MAKPADIKKRARRLANEGKIVDAIRALEEVTSQGHVDPYDLVMMGDLCIRGGRSDDATGYYERAVEAYSEASLHRNGIALCRKVLRVQPGQATFLRLLSELCEREGLVLDAVSGYLEYAEGLDPDEEAVDRDWLDSLARLRPRNTEIITRQAEMLFRWGRVPDAVGLLRAGAESVSRDEDRNQLLEMASQMAAMGGEGTGDPEFDAEMNEFLGEAEPELQRPQVTVNETSGEMNMRDMTFQKIDEEAAAEAAAEAPPEASTGASSALGFGEIDLSEDTDADGPSTPAAPGLFDDTAAPLEPPETDATAPEPVAEPPASAEPIAEPPTAAAPESSAEEPAIAEVPPALDLEAHAPEPAPGEDAFVGPLPPSAEAPEPTSFEDVQTTGEFSLDAGTIDLDAALDEESAGTPVESVEATAPEVNQDTSPDDETSRPVVGDRGEVLEIDADEDYASALAELNAFEDSRSHAKPELPVPEATAEETAPASDANDPALAEASGRADANQAFAEAFGEIQLDADADADAGDDDADAHDPDETQQLNAAELQERLAPEVVDSMEKTETPSGRGPKELPEDVATLQMLLLEDPFDRKVLGKLLEAHLREGDILSAQDLRERLTTVHLQAGDGAAALQVYRDFLEVEPAHREMRERASRLARELGQPLELPEEGADGGKKPDALFNVKGLSNVEVRDDAPSVSEDDMVDLGALLDEFRSGIKSSLEGADPRTHYDMGLSHLEMGLYDEAAEAFAEASIDPELEAEARELWGRALRLGGRGGDATRVLRAALALRPESLGVRYQLALALEDSGEPEEAQRLHQSILREDPNFEDVSARVEALGGSDCTTPRTPGSSG